MAGRQTASVSTVAITMTSYDLQHPSTQSVRTLTFFTQVVRDLVVTQFAAIFDVYYTSHHTAFGPAIPGGKEDTDVPVSYTHLTLPTIYSV